MSRMDPSDRRKPDTILPLIIILLLFLLGIGILIGIGYGIYKLATRKSREQEKLQEECTRIANSYSADKYKGAYWPEDYYPK